MTFLGTCCRDQQIKQSNKVLTCNKKQTTIYGLALTLLIVFAMTVSTASAQMALVRTNSAQAGMTQAGVVKANVKLELITSPERLVDSTGSRLIAIGSEVGLRVSSDRDTYIYIYNYDAAGTLSPLTDSTNNFLRVGSVYNYPSMNSRYEVLGPAGRENIFAIASLRPLNSNRLQQLVMLQIQSMLGGTTHVTNSRALINGGSSPYTTQDGWLVDNIVFDVYSANAAPVTQAPITQLPTTQAPTIQAPTTQIPVTKPAPIHTTPQPSSTSQKPNTFKACTLANLSLSAPSHSIGFSQRCINRSFDSSFENPASMRDIVVHFGTELSKQGFSYEATTKAEELDFRATFSYQGKTYQMQVEKSRQFYRFELLEFSQQAMN